MIEKSMHLFNKYYKKILITGGAGFIGGALIRKLLKETDSVIYNLDKMGYASDLTSINQTISKLKESKVCNHIHLKIDLKKRTDLEEAFIKIDPDIVFHLAAESHVDRSIEGPYQFIDSNIIGTYNLLQSTRNHWEKISIDKQKIFKLIHISTDEVFGSLPEKGKFNEGSPYDPRSPYSASKASSDHLVKAWYQTYGLPSIVTNCSNNYGPWQYPEKLIPVIIKKAIRQEKIPIYGDGLNVRDWLYVDDHIDALIKVAESGVLGESYCIGGNNEITNLDLANLICKIINTKHSKSFKHESLIKFVDDRLGHDRRYAISTKKIKEKLNWNPKIPFEVGLNKTVDWYLKNQDWLMKKINED